MNKKLPSSRRCSGCLMCVDLCPQSAIVVDQAADGFRYVKIDKNKCNHCGLCEKRCPVNQNNYATNNDFASSRAYIAWSLNHALRTESSSGGVFSALALSVLAGGGLVAGAVLTGTTVRHILTDDPQDLAKMRGSKYLQSDPSGIYLAIRQALRAEKTVLFSGTPCQGAAVIAFCGQSLREKLIVVDFICHGVPSSQILTLVEYGCGETIKELVSFRDKIDSASASFALRFINSDGDLIRLPQADNTFINLYISSLLYRDSCYWCPFAKIKHQSDLTLADFYEKPELSKDEQSGITLIVSHTEKGETILHSLADLRMECYPLTDALSRKFNSYTSNILLYFHPARRLLRFFIAVLPVWLQYVIYNQRQRRGFWTLPLKGMEKVLFLLEEARIRHMRRKFFKF